jgi:hypothetical protein
VATGRGSCARCILDDGRSMTYVRAWRDGGVAHWTVVLSSRKHVDGWLGEAHRLRALLDVVSEAISVEYGAPLSWHDEDTTVAQWKDLGSIAALMEADQLRDDAGKIMKRGGATSVVQGYWPNTAECVVNAIWDAGYRTDWPFNCVLTFYGVRPLHEHSHEWLVGLLNNANSIIEGYTGRIETTPLIDELMNARFESRVGDLTVIQHKIDVAALPESVTVYPGPAHNPDAIVVVADLEKAAEDPKAVVSDLLRVDDLIVEPG